MVRHLTSLSLLPKQKLIRMSAFTSRLPKSTSARRPSNPNDGSTSHLYSNIPVSVRKANLFTPQPKRSLQNGTFSSTARKSSMTTDKKYQRPLKPIPDRDEQHRMFESLVDFLRMNAPTFPLPDERKFFMSVGTTETARIFEFLISRLYPDFKINKLEIDVPEALALLEYPYIRTVTKSALVSITTRQAIANLLVIFDWLVEEMKLANCSDAFTETESDSVKVCKSVLTNPECPGDEIRREDKATSLEAASSELERLNEEYMLLAASVQELDEVQLERQALVEDSDKCKEYKDQMKKYLAIKTEEANTIDEDCRMLEQNEIEEKIKAHEILLLEIQEQPKCDTLAVARAREKIKSIEKDIESDKRKGEAEIVQSSTLLAKEEHDLARINDRVAYEEARLRKLISAELSNLEHDKDKDAKNAQLHLECLKNTLEGNRQEMIAAVNKEELELRQWIEVKQVCKNDNKLAKNALKTMQ